MNKLVIVGSGASGVHFALSVLKKGYRILMLDVGKEKPRTVNPEDSLQELKTNLKDPARFFLGSDFESVLYPDSASEYYGFPPSKNYVFSKPSRFKYRSDGFVPLFSFAQGGLAEAWTGGVYPFNEEELQRFPFGYRELEPHYNTVAKRIGISGLRDDLDRFFPFHENIMEPLELDVHSQRLLATYEKHKTHLNGKFGSYLGRSRTAALTQDRDDRPGCSYEGRCLWGCPSQAFYTPSVTLEECKKYPNFEYRPNLLVTHFIYNDDRKITRVVAESTENYERYDFELDNLVLAAGALSSSKIYMDSLYRERGEIIKLGGLMDNTQVLAPFLNLKLLGEPFNPESYQYHQLVIGIEGERPGHFIHSLVTTLKTALIHPIIQSMPMDLKSSAFFFRNVHAALGLVNINLHDERRDENCLTLEDDGNASNTRLLVRYVPNESESRAVKGAVNKVKKILRMLGCVVPPGMVHCRPKGSSVHYSGTLPMSKEKTPYTTSRDCRSHDFDNLYIVDGTTFPFLPAKNITFTLMANAVRVAETVF